MNLIFLVSMLSVNAVLLVSSLFEELNGNLTELSIAENVFFLFNPFCTFFADCVKLRLEKICRTTVNRLVIADNLLSEFRVNRNRCLTIFSSYYSLEFLCYSLVSFTCDYIEYSLCTDNLS